jgi:hypothetical protein
MSFYIKIDNPDAGKQTGRDAGLAGSPAEGPKKAFLVTAFTSVVGAAHPPHPPDRQRGGKDQSWVAVTLAEHGTMTLPFSADEFEEIVTEAQRRGRIADFSSDHLADRINDLAARRNHPAVEAPASPALDRARRLRDAYLERLPSPPTRHWNFEPGPFNPNDPAIEGLSPRLGRWFAEHSIRPVPRHGGADVELIASDWLMASGAASAFAEYFLDRVIESRTAAPPPVKGLLEASPGERQKMRDWLMSSENRAPSISRRPEIERSHG